MRRWTRTRAGGQVGEIRRLGQPLQHLADLDPIVERVTQARVVGIGEASHGMSEFYRWRAELSRLLIERHGFGWVGVEGPPGRNATIGG